MENHFVFSYLKRLICFFAFSYLCFLSLRLSPRLCRSSFLHQLRSQDSNAFRMCNRWWDAFREPVFWQTLHYLKFLFATENSLWGVNHKITLGSVYIPLILDWIQNSFYMKSRVLFIGLWKVLTTSCRPYPSRSSTTSTAGSKFIQINFCSKILLQL